MNEQTGRYLAMIDAAAGQLSGLIDELSLSARIESGRWEPLLAEVDSLRLAREAAEPLAETVGVSGQGSRVAVDVNSARRALRALARCAVRHGGLEHVDLGVDGPLLVFAPVTAETAAICLGRELRDFPAAVAVRAIRALGGTTEGEAETLRVRLPQAPVIG